MAKDAYYFSHDANARSDQKIRQMRSVYHNEGYALYFMLLEMMRSEENYKLSMQGKYVWNAFASELDTDVEKIKAFVGDCINEFKLFVSDGQNFWSESFLERMKLKDEKSEKARKSAEARWNKSKKPKENEHLMQPHGEDDANASENDAIKESKVKEIKEKEIETKITKIHYADNVSMTEEEYTKLISEYGEVLIKDKIIDLDLWKGSKDRKTKSDYLTIKAWIRKDQKENKVYQTKPNGIKEIPKNPRRRDDF
jgi:hypothetical protein